MRKHINMHMCMLLPQASRGDVDTARREMQAAEQARAAELAEHAYALAGAEVERIQQARETREAALATHRAEWELEAMLKRAEGAEAALAVTKAQRDDSLAQSERDCDALSQAADRWRADRDALHAANARIQDLEGQRMALADKSQLIQGQHECGQLVNLEPGRDDNIGGDATRITDLEAELATALADGAALRRQLTVMGWTATAGMNEMDVVRDVLATVGSKSVDVDTGDAATQLSWLRTKLADSLARYDQVH